MRAFVLVALALAGGCYAPSLGSDVARVRDLSRVPALGSFEEAPVDASVSEEVRGLLAAPLDAEAAVRIALANNRELRATLRELGVARGRLVQAGLLPNPVVEGEVLPERNTALELRVEYDLTRAILAPLRARAAAADLEAERYRIAGAVVEAGFTVRAAFYALQAAEQRLAIGQRSIDAAAAARDAARALFDAGNIPELDARTEEAAYERARIAVAQLELEVADRRERLQRLLGLHGPHTAWQAAGPLALAPATLPPREGVERLALEASLELGEARGRLDALARRIGLTRTEGFLPDIAVDVHTLLGDPEPRASEAVSGGWRVGGGVSLTLPLFDRRQGTVSAQKAELDAMVERYVGMAIDVRSAAREARNRLASAHARARQFEDAILPAQGRVTDQTLLQYNAMQVGVFQLLQARREQLDAEQDHIETLREYWTAVAAQQALLAGRRVGGVASASPAGLAAGAASTGGH
ncbi:MAG: TolC family protein [Myxococcales bacterium]|nr:TolC family protein [Myxococcales bacterium]